MCLWHRFLSLQDLSFLLTDVCNSIIRQFYLYRLFKCNTEERCAMLPLSLKLHLFCWEHADGWDFVFSFCGSPPPVLGTCYHRTIELQGMSQISGPHPLITGKNMKLKGRRETRIVQSDSASEWQSWNQNCGLHSQSAIHSLSNYWALLCAGHCTVSWGHGNDDYKCFFPIESFNQSALATFKNQLLPWLYLPKCNYRNESLAFAD